MLRNLFFFVTLLITVCFASCVPPEMNKVKYKNVNIDFNDKQIQTILNLEERQAADSLLPFLKNQNPTYRYLAAMAFAGLKDGKGTDSLIKLLHDDFTEVRTAAAFALGQIGDKRADSALTSAYQNKDTTGKYAVFNQTVLEAVGQCGSSERLNQIVGIKTFRSSDTALLLGQAYGLLRFGLRDIFSGAAVQKMLSFAQPQNNNTELRGVAAYYLGRLKTKYDTSVTNKLSQYVLSEKEPTVRMYEVKALGKSYRPENLLPVFEQLIRNEQDYRVKIQLINALAGVPYNKADAVVQEYLKDKNEHVSNAAALWFSNNGNAAEANGYYNRAFDNQYPASTRHIMSAAALRYFTKVPVMRDSLTNILKTEYASEKNIYVKAEILKSIAADEENYDFLNDEALNPANPPVVRTVAAEEIGKISALPDFSERFRNRTPSVKRELKSILFGLVRTADAGVATAGADAIRNPAANFNIEMMKDSIPILYQILQKLILPKEIEAYESIRQTLNYISDTATVPKKKGLSPRTTDWLVVKTLTNAVAIVKTDKGIFKMQLLTQNAPISVCNFVTLARSGFFNGKIFHRVVPGFVVQTGCPRGDGYGSLDYTIASELTPMHYNTEGFVGMASAGNHTECSQWFVTTAPTLHLDGNYSIFGKITEGMEVVHALTQGSVVESVTVQ